MAQARSEKSNHVPLSRIARRQTLAQAFARVARAGGGPGGDGLTVAEFVGDTRRHLDGLARQLADDSYRPGPLRRYGLPKAGGGIRRLAVPCVRDRVVQSAVAHGLATAFDDTMSEASFAYRRGLSVEHAGALVMFHCLRGFRWAVDGDIERFFDSVPHAGIAHMLKELGVCERTVGLVGLWLSGCSRNGRGLPQGAPVSPVLANLYLAPFDKAVETRRVKLVRYADDFLLLTRSKREAGRARAGAEKALAALGLRLNDRKTRIANLRRGVTFLGLDITSSKIGRAA